MTPTYDTHVSPFSDDYVGTGTASLSETTEELVLDTTGNVKNSDLYIKAPLEFTTAVDGLFKYANSILGTPSCHAKIAAAFMKHLDYVASVSSFSDAKYYAFLSLNCEELPANDYSKAIVQLINADQNLRELISEKALEEITKAFGPLYGITDTETFEELRDCLLGDRFIQDGLGHGSDWNRFIELVTDPMLVATQNSVNNNKEPVIWSGFEDEYHAEMDKVFTTIANTSIAGIDFIENVYTDWYGAATPFSSSKLWANLSVAYANACSTVINPATGQVYDSIKFLYPLGKNVTDMFGELFKTCELPTIVANGTIKTITLSATDPGTMKVLSTVDIDITELIDYYLKYSIPGVVDNAINDKLFEMFYEKVKEVM